MKTWISETRFPQLHNQIRTSTGYTVAPGGVIKLPPGWGDMPRTETPVPRDITVAPKTRAKSKRSKIKGDL